jgi:hypothetical protein
MYPLLVSDMKARFAQASDLEQLLDLFRVSEVSTIAAPIDHAERIWSETLAREGVVVFVSDAGARIAATCMLITAPNILRSGRAHGYLDNVVTHPAFRGRGMVAQLLRPLSPRRGQGIAATSCFRVAERTLGCIGSMRGAASSRVSGSDMSRDIQRRSCVAFVLFSRKQTRCHGAKRQKTRSGAANDPNPAPRRQHHPRSRGER